ncbi:hypothetical protein SBFV3_gp52 [Sulfolobales Beppu filamentous virus 3]|uniref:Uncharacterized protein n=1 Tax=Sulfolobales Beppu filamentous virus 3 TaxID=2493124 RepID=A0A3S8NF37_9VIRU|nr:hypothetical protein HOU83_gp52 [Sulfolobales Beppu filamentous virus 3]AZI75887.1 hypothetical protein SBFV3_gp52 [Sulfolobales Beppu filamentous virus 3]
MLNTSECELDKVIAYKIEECLIQKGKADVIKLYDNKELKAMTVIVYGSFTVVYSENDDKLEVYANGNKIMTTPSPNGGSNLVICGDEIKNANIDISIRIGHELIITMR